MAGHSKWKQIKHKKAAQDEKRGKLFSKLAGQIAIAARNGADPQFNPALRSAIEQAKRNNMPQANIDRALQRARAKGGLESVLIEIYGPGGVGILVEAETDNRNRTFGELRAIAKESEAKIAEPSGVLWAFEKTDGGYRPKFPQEVSGETKSRVAELTRLLEAHDDVRAVYSTL